MGQADIAKGLNRATSFALRESVSGPANDFIELDFEQRRRRRIVFKTAGGLLFLLDLPKAGCLRGGDHLNLDDGRSIEVRVAKEDLTEVCASNPNHLATLAYHLGNRHLEVQICDSRILIRRDHVIEKMIRGLGGSVRQVFEPFEPEAGAYHEHSSGHSHSHSQEPQDV